MDSKLKDKEQVLEPEEKNEKLEDEPREVPDKELEGIAGGTTPIIKPF
jgi:hypothetical protein